MIEFERCFFEMNRVLRRDRIGKILHVSDEDPDVRIQFLEDRLNRVVSVSDNDNNKNDGDVDRRTISISLTTVIPSLIPFPLLSNLWISGIGKSSSTLSPE